MSYIYYQCVSSRNIKIWSDVDVPKAHLTIVAYVSQPANTTGVTTPDPVFLDQTSGIICQTFVGYAGYLTNGSYGFTNKSQLVVMRIMSMPKCDAANALTITVPMSMNMNLTTVSVRPDDYVIHFWPRSNFINVINVGPDKEYFYHLLRETINAYLKSKPVVLSTSESQDFYKIGAIQPSLTL